MCVAIIIQISSSDGNFYNNKCLTVTIPIINLSSLIYFTKYLFIIKVFLLILFHIHFL